MDNNTKLKVIGLMSGTSKDGIDLAYIETDGHFFIKEIASAFFAYNQSEKTLLNLAEYLVNKTSGELNKFEEIPQFLLLEFAEKEGINATVVENYKRMLTDKGYNFSIAGIEYLSTILHYFAVESFLSQSKLEASNIDLIGYHGQTIFHRPSEKKSIQLGLGELLAEKTNIRTIFDFRSKDIKAGGQGAPFAPLYHFAIAKRDQLIPSIIVNIGGISNVTIMNEKEIIGAFDTGPGNCLIDAYTKLKCDLECDVDGKLGLAGKVFEDHLVEFSNFVIPNTNNFIKSPPPKSLDVRDCIIPQKIFDLSPKDACATLAALTAHFIIESLAFYDLNKIPDKMIIAGGGRKNPVILRELKLKFAKKFGENAKVLNADEVNWSGDALEAQLFAYLAVRSLKKLPISIPETTGVPKPTTGGLLAEPNLVN
ncbi:MAG: anhydro-N-acetylmuramic acid kinase [Bdellovibrionales bacterium]|nr:anhydro-N-acetylmuramic acid kinase [Bdellovibrionales bacterium]